MKAKIRRRKVERGDKRDFGRKVCRVEGGNSRSRWSLEGEGGWPPYARNREEVYTGPVNRIKFENIISPALCRYFMWPQELNIYT